MLHNRNPEYFLTIAREGSITRAAEKLFISQSSLSQHVAKLEEKLETRLFDRSQTPLALTPAGELYRDYLERSAGLYQQFLSGLAGLNASRSQTLRLGLGTWRGSMLLPRLLPDLLLDHPQAQVSLREFPISELYAMMEDGSIDFSLMNTPEAGVPEGFDHEVILRERILLVLRRDSPAAEHFIRGRTGSPEDLRALEGERLISLSETLTVGRHVEDYLRRSGLRFSRRLTSTNNDTVLQLTARGAGFCFMVEGGLEEAGRDPALAFFDLNAPELTLPLSLVWKRSACLSPLALDTMDRIRLHCRAARETNAHLLR